MLRRFLFTDVLLLVNNFMRGLFKILHEFSIWKPNQSFTLLWPSLDSFSIKCWRLQWNFLQNISIVLCIVINQFDFRDIAIHIHILVLIKKIFLLWILSDTRIPTTNIIFIALCNDFLKLWMELLDFAIFFFN